MYAGVPSVRPGAGDAAVVGRLAQRLGDAEVHHVGMPGAEHHVFRLDVAVDHALAVGVTQRVGDLAPDARGIGRS